MFAGQPLFDCVDKVALMDGVSDLAVTCRIISIHSVLTDVSVRVRVGTNRTFTIDAGPPTIVTDYPYQTDPRYVVRVEPKRVTVRIYVDRSDVVLGLGPWLSLRTKSQSLDLALALKVWSLLLALALSLESLLTSLVDRLLPFYGPQSGSATATHYLLLQ